jgi:hypothetical protein
LLEHERDVDARLFLAYELGLNAAVIGVRGHLPDLLHGKRMKPGSRLGGFNARRRATAESRRARIAELCTETHRTRGALVAWLRERLAAEGFPASARTVIEDLKILRSTR